MQKHTADEATLAYIFLVHLKITSNGAGTEEKKKKEQEWSS